MSDSTLVYFNFLNKPINISSILCEFSVFGHDITIRWYGAIIAFGFLLAVLFGGRIAYTWKMSLDKMVDVLIYGTLSGIVGARLYYVFSKWNYYSHNISFSMACILLSCYIRWLDLRIDSGLYCM